MNQTYAMIMIVSVLVSPILSAVAVIAVIKNDIRWIKTWCQTHEASDVDRFAIQDTARHELRNELATMSTRLALLEGRIGGRL